MTARLLQRIAQGVFVVWVAATLTFVLLQLAPGDPLAEMADHEGMTPELRAQMRAAYGLDEPAHVQYMRWIGLLVRGEFGFSRTHNKSVAAVLAETVPNTVLLMSAALISSIIFGLAIGAWQAFRARQAGDRAVSLATFIVYAMPEFWLATILVMVFAGKLHWFPTSGSTSDFAVYLPFGERMLNRMHHFVLPWLSLTIVGTAIFARIQRGATRQVASEQFVANARSRGLPESRVRRQAVRASLTPAVTLAGLFFPSLVGGAVFVETVFTLNGVGWTLLKAIRTHDVMLVCAIVILGSALTVIGGLLANVAREYLDPRLRRGHA